MGKINRNDYVKLFICMGVSFIFASFIYLKLLIGGGDQIIKDLYENYGSEITSASIYILFGFVFIFYAVVFYMSTNKKLKNNRFQIFIISIFFLYAMASTRVLTLKPNNEDFLIISLMLWITGFLYLIINLIIYGKNILNATINEPKDRITVVLAIGGAIISLIALFK